MDLVLQGEPIEVRYTRRLRDDAGNEAHAAADLRKRVILLDSALKRNPAERQRILLHEVFHFAWIRLGNSRRSEWARMLGREIRAGVAGEAGWSAEWRKDALRTRDMAEKTRRWKIYCAEAFCDTAAFVFGTESEEVTLPRRVRIARRRAMRSLFTDIIRV